MFLKHPQMVQVTFLATMVLNLCKLSVQAQAILVIDIMQLSTIPIWSLDSDSRHFYRFFYDSEADDMYTCMVHKPQSDMTITYFVVYKSYCLNSNIINSQVYWIYQ
jgi:hypothetical protein